MRDISNTIQEVLDRDFAETKYTVRLTIPATTGTPSYPETTLYYTNGEGIYVDGQIYQDKVREIGQIRFSLGSAPDNTDVTLENVSRDLGFILTDTQRVIDGSEVIIDKIYKIDDGTWEPITLFVGQVTDINVDKEKIKLSIVSDMSKRGTSVGNKTATQRCILVFNANGSGIGPECGWNPSLPGNATSCDHTVDGANGCMAHGNIQRIGAVPAFTTLGDNTSGNGYDPVYNPPGGVGYCVHPDTFILTEFEGKRTWVKAYQIKDNSEVVSMNEFGNIITTKMTSKSTGTTTRLYEVVTKKGYAISCSPSHPFITSKEDTKGTPCHKLNVGDKVLALDFESKEYFEDTIDIIEVHNYSCNVIILHLEEPFHIYIGGKTTEGGLLFHNSKPIYTDPIFV